MALIKCPKCGKDFSDRAQACPQCGTSMEEVQRLIKERKEQKVREAAERERTRKEREVKKAEEARIRAEKRAEWWKENRKSVIIWVLVLFALFCGYVLYINTMPISAKNGAELQSALQNPLRFSKGSTIVKIPNKVTYIEERAFYDCCDVTSIEISHNATIIGNSAFARCTGLTSIEIPNSVSSIESSAFYSCSSLTSLSIPNSVTSIGNYAFGSCCSLTSLSIPNSVISIGNYAFYGCTSLTIEIPMRFKRKVDLSNCKEVIYY